MLDPPRTIFSKILVPKKIIKTSDLGSNFDLSLFQENNNIVKTCFKIIQLFRMHACRILFMNTSCTVFNRQARQSPAISPKPTIEEKAKERSFLHPVLSYSGVVSMI